MAETVKAFSFKKPLMYGHKVVGELGISFGYEGRE